MNRNRMSWGALGAALSIAALALTVGTTMGASRTVPKEKAVTADTLAKSLTAQAHAILKKHCVRCHSGARPKARLSLEPEKLVAVMGDVPSVQIDTLKLIDTRNPAKSYFLMKVRGDKGIKGSRMPDHAPPLSADAAKTLDLWVRGFAASPRQKPAAAPDTSGAKK